MSEDDPECTDCGGSGISYQTERRCACQPPVAPNANESADYWRGRYEGMMETLRKTHTPEQLAEMGFV